MIPYYFNHNYYCYWCNNKLFKGHKEIECGNCTDTVLFDIINGKAYPGYILNYFNDDEEFVEIYYETKFIQNKISINARIAYLNFPENKPIIFKHFILNNIEEYIFTPYNIQDLWPKYQKYLVLI